MRSRANAYGPLVLALLCVALAVAFLRPTQTPGPVLRDFEAYWGAGSAYDTGADPYARGIWRFERRVAGVDATRDELLPFVGPPATLPLWGTLARLSYPAAAHVWTIVLALAALALATLVAYASAPLSPITFFAACALAIAFGPLTSDLALGQVALPAFTAAVIVTLPTSVLSRAIAALVAFAQPNVSIGLATQFGRNRATAALAIGGLATYAAAAIAGGWNWPLRYAGRLWTHGTAERWSVIQITPGAIAYGAGAPDRLAVSIAVATAVLALISAALLWRRIGDPFARFAAVAPLAPFVSTFFHEHDLVVAYAAAGWCALRSAGRTRALALVATLLVAIDWLGLAQRPSGVAQSAALAAAAASAFLAASNTNIARRRQRNRNDRRDPAAGMAMLLGAIGIVAALFAIAAWLATTHPAPVWPDAIGAFHAPAHASASLVWNQEQLRAGLLAREPVWAFLRLLPLAGCALLSLGVCLTCGDASPHAIRRRRAG